MSARKKITEYKTRIDIHSPKLLNEVKQFIKDNDQTEGYSTSLGIISIENKVIKSKLEPFDLIWRMTYYFNQHATATCQSGDIALVNSDTHENNNDTPVSRNCGLHQVWYNACVSTRTNDFSRIF